MAKAIKDIKKAASKKYFPVVGVGASAGGLDAFKELLHAITPDSGMAYILVQHLHPKHSSSLPEILQRETSVPVQEVRDNVTVKPNNIYVIPSNRTLVANDGVLQLSERPTDHKNMLIDIFFSSLAEVHQDKSVGIVLSGTGSDGTEGLKKIKDTGGITFSQDPASAGYDDMPQSAIKAGVVDFILTASKMPKRLQEIVDTFERFDVDGNPAPEEKTEEESYRKILSLLRLRYGADFNNYKQTTIRRRILRRLAILKIEKVSDYLKLLQQNKEEQNILFYDLLIPVTSFFRDPKTFENLSTNVFPELIKGKSVANPLRVWVAGCSTGEEAYSMAIYLYEFLNDKVSNIKIQIFATDISEQAITKARAGVYDVRQLEGLSDQRRQQFFTKTDGGYQVKKIIRDICVFATHNFLKDPPFAKIDLISCRNVLIYMEPFLQKKAFAVFYYALSEKGFLLLGKSETTGSSSDLFQMFGKKDKLYTKKAGAGKFVSVASQIREERIKDKDYSLQSNERRKEDFQNNADDIILSKYAPPAVIINGQFDIVQFRGSTGPYLEPAPGKASLNVLRMAREGLSFELRNALHKVKTTGKPLIREGIPVNKEKKSITIEVIPLLKTADPHFLILFKDDEEVTGKTEKELAKHKKVPAAKTKDVKDDRIKQLETDLAQAREDMRTITEDQEAANEELQSANEELLSGSEELQSLNEEMETSKEELQSTNEELITVNQELFDRNEQYNRSRIYAEAIVSTIHEPLLVLNFNFSIRSANKSFYRTFSLTEKDALGKSLFELQNNSWDMPTLKDYLLEIQQQNEKSLEWEITHTFPHIGIRTICFNAQLITEENGNLLILLALDDITLRKEAEKLQGFQNMKFILESMPLITFSASAEGEFTFFNDYFSEYTGLPLKTALEKGWLPAINPDEADEVTKSWKHSLQTFENFSCEFQLKRKSDGMSRWHLCRATAIINDGGEVTSWVGNATDIHQQKAKEKAKDEFIGTASHELRTPLTSAKLYVQLIEASMAKTENPDIIFARKAGASLERLNSLVMELLDETKIQHGKLGLIISSFNFNNMLDDAIEAVQLSSRGHTIIKTGEIEKKITGDEERLKQVVINLLTNAVKYSPHADKVFVHASEEDGEVKVSIRDEGIGISKRNLNKIFERYFREEGQHPQFQGLGIGLSISKEIIQRHKGRLWAESDLGEGSTFYFTLPVRSS